VAFLFPAHIRVAILFARTGAEAQSRQGISRDAFWAFTPAGNIFGEPSMSSVEVEQKSYEMPPREGFSIAHFLTVADIERSARFYETVFGGRILSRGDGKGAPGYIQIANSWLIVNVGGGPTPDKPSVTLSVLADPDRISSFMNIRVADIQACYKLWKSRGAEFITEPKDKYGETRCYIRDPDGYIIEVGQSKPDFTYG
jgi:predicted enzyme related to lactoylglutathione lyase